MLCIRLIVHISNINTLNSIYYAYFHSYIKHGIIFWGNSFNSEEISLYKRKSSELMAGAKPYLNN
jgi:hypothetical protein